MPQADQPVQVASRTAPDPDVAALLDGMGLAIGARQVELLDFNLAESCYIHGSNAPVALIGYALVSPAFARGRFPELRFLDLMRIRPGMDATSAQAIATLCGAKVTPPFWGNPEPFGTHLWNVIATYSLEAFFVRLPDESNYGARGAHYAMRPRGYDWETWEPDAPALKAWRTAYRALPEVRQLMVATIVRLYNSDESTWLVRVPKAWHAADAIQILHAEGALPDWGKLMAIYPGW